jgi:hypothetical protein
MTQAEKEEWLRRRRLLDPWDWLNVQLMLDPDFLAHSAADLDAALAELKRRAGE